MTETAFNDRLTFRPIDLDAHFDECVRFVIDTHLCGFGSAARFYEDVGRGAERYRARLEKKRATLPGAAVHVWQGDSIIGQIEMSRVASDPTIGYVNLFYLIPEARGRGLGAILEAYAWTFLSGLGCQSLRLSATLSNTPAWRFYQRAGWHDLGFRADFPEVQLLQKFADDDAAGSPLLINQDDYLNTESGRAFTPERNRQAWESAYQRLDSVLADARPGTHVYVVMGVQGAGKSHWVSHNLGRLGHRAIVFDAALPARRHRERLLTIIREHRVPAIGVFIPAMLVVALARNARRSVDTQVPEAALRSIFEQLEPPVEAEGFAWVQTVEPRTWLPVVLRTPRLTLVAPDLALAEKLADALNASYTLHREFLLWSKPHWTVEETRESLEQAYAAFTSVTDEKRYFVLRNSEAQELVGCIGLTPLEGPDAGFEIGYWASQQHAGQGLLKEALAALVAEFAEHHLMLTTSSANLRSQKLAESAGLHCVEVIKAARNCEFFGTQDTLVYRHRAPSFDATLEGERLPHAEDR